MAVRFIARGCIFHWRLFHPTWRFGAWLTADSIVINYVNTNLSTLVLARILGASVAGGYNLAYNVAVVPPMKLNPIITRVLFPAFAKIQDEILKAARELLQAALRRGDHQLPGAAGADGGCQHRTAGVWREVEQHHPDPATAVRRGAAALGGEPDWFSANGAKARVDISFKFNVFKTFLSIRQWLWALLAGAIA